MSPDHTEDDYSPLPHNDNSHGFTDTSVASTVTQGENVYHISFSSNAAFTGRGHLFHYLRGALSAHFGGRFLSVKYAALVTSSDYQVIHDPRLLLVYVDPLAIFRDAAAAVNRDKCITLHALPSQPYYFRGRIAAPGKGGSRFSGSRRPRDISSAPLDVLGGCPGNAAGDFRGGSPEADCEQS